MITVKIRRTWTHIEEVEVEADAAPTAILNDPTLEDRFMEAYTQGDGHTTDEIVAER